MFADFGWEPLADSTLYDAWWLPRPLRRAFAGTHHLVRSELEPSVCAERLRELVTDVPGERMPRRLCGEVTAYRFTLQARGNVGVARATSLTAVGRIESAPDGTAMRVRVALAPGDCVGYLLLLAMGALGWPILAKVLFLDNEPLGSQAVKHAVFALAFPLSVGFSALVVWQAANGNVISPFQQIVDAVEGTIDPGGSDSFLWR